MNQAEWWEELMRAQTLGSKKILDNIGIYINTKTLPSWDIYVRATDDRYGRGRLGRFWAKYLRSLIQPSKNDWLCEHHHLAENIIRQEFMNACMKRALEVGP